MSWPSANLLAQSALSGLFVGSLYGLIGLGLGLSWGLLRTINLAHFAFVFGGAYIAYQLNASTGIDPLLTVAVIVPLFFGAGLGLHAVVTRFKVSALNTLLLTFGLTAIIEAIIQAVWSADFRRLEWRHGDVKFKLGELFVPLPELITLGVALAATFALWRVLRGTDLGKAMRAAAQDAPIAAAFGVNQHRLSLLLAGTCAALAGVAGVCLSLSFTLAPSQIYAWVGVVFAAVMMGGLGSPVGPLVAGIVIGVSEALTMAITAPSWAPIVSFTLLIVLLLVRPGRL